MWLVTIRSALFRTHCERNLGSNWRREIKVVENRPRPLRVKKLLALHETVDCYRQYFYKLDTIAQPLHRLPSKKQIGHGEKQNFFKLLKRRLASALVLGHPDLTKTYLLDTDNSRFGVEAVLSQEQDEEKWVIAYYSKTLFPPERNYYVTRGKLLVTVKAFEQLRLYLYKQKFQLHTDHALLR